MALTKVSRGLLSTGIVDNSNATAITIDSSENVGIGVAPSAWSSAFGSVMQLNSGSGGGALAGSGTDNFRMFANTYYDGAYKKIGTGFSTMYEQASGSHIWFSNASSAANATFTPTPRMRLDASGNFLVGGTTYEGSTTSNASSAYIASSGFISANVTNDFGMQVNRTGTDGTLINLRKNGADVGRIGNSGTRFVVHGTYTGGAGLYFGSNVVLPTNNAGALSDGAVSLGQSNYRYNTIFAAAGSINTSDRNEKQDIEELSDAEQRVAVAAKGLLRKFRWIDAVEAKGDDARIHFGIIAQDLQDAFTAEGLDAARYGMWCSDTWWETQTEVAAVEATEDTEAVDAYTRTDTYDTAEEAPEGATERTRLGVRYSELLAFIISAI